MSLNLILLNRYGIWQSSDHRLTDPITGRITDDYVFKQLPIQCTDGHMLLAFAGLGSRYLPGPREVYLIDWLRCFLRGESLSVRDTAELIRRRCNIDLGRVLYNGRCRHMFNIGFFWGGEPWACQIANFARDPNNVWGPLSMEFSTTCTSLAQVGLMSGLAGFPFLPQVKKAFAPYREVTAQQPNNPRDFMELLALVNQRVAKSFGSDGPISEHCTVTYVPPEGLSWRSETFFLPGGVLRQPTPYLFLGLDFHDSTKVMSKFGTPGFAMPDHAQLEALSREAAIRRILF